MTPLRALQAGLAGEHAAVYLYAVLGARVSQSATPILYDDLLGTYQAHRRRRDDLTAMIVRRQATPVAAQVSYEIPAQLATPAQLKALALQIETRLTALHGQLVGSTSGSERRWALRALDEVAVKQLAFGGQPGDLPGLSG